MSTYEEFMVILTVGLLIVAIMNIDNMQSIEFTFIPPNFIDGYDNVNNYIDGFHDYNPDKITTKIENTEGNLKIPQNRTFIQDAIEYISSGAGHWKLVAKNEEPIKSSEELPIINQLPTDLSDLNTYQKEKINQIFKDISEIQITK